jgi:Mrp family chromosome partitioning ATPase
MIQQFLSETDWGELDYLLIDTPPGTSDEHISTVQYLQGALSEGKTTCALGGAVVITTPEEMSMADVRKELNFCKKTMLPVVGVVENMSKFQTRLDQLQFFNAEDPSTDRSEHVLQVLREHCPQILDMVVTANVFPVSGLGPLGMAHQFGVPYLGHVPLDSDLLKCCEAGSCFVERYPGSPTVHPLNSIVDGILHALPLEEVETVE